MKLDIEEKQEPQENTVIDWNNLYKSTIIDLSKKIDRPPLCISVGVDDKEYKGVRYPLRFATYGNISIIMAEEKARKTFFKSLIISCSIGGNSNNYSEEIKGHDLEDKYIIDIDTEQGDYDAWLTATRIKEMCGYIPENYIPVALREYTNSERRDYLRWLFSESPWVGKIGLVSIDGYVDMVNDFNDLKECISFTSDLMKYSKNENCHIMGMLHVNPGSEKGRGHLGTIIAQKCETITMIKNEGEFSRIWRKRGRGKPFNEMGISVDDNWLPYEIDLESIDIVEKEQNPFK